MDRETDDERRPGGDATARVPIVGVGASAGGIGALRAFFSGVSPECRLAFVVVMHLHPDKESALPDILGRFNPLPTTLVDEDTAVEAGHVYVIAPKTLLTMREGRLTTRRCAGTSGHRSQIDNFLASLAIDHEERAACVILSGTGSDGTLGLRAIKEHGGLAVAQEGAEFDGMMHSAVATGLVDVVLPAEDIPRKLEEYFLSLGDGQSADPEQGRRDVLEQLERICALLRGRTGHDFSNYKDSTVVRRIQRRMQVLQIPSAGAYADRLRGEPRELDLLFQDLLIGVTSFFRDADAFEALEANVIAPLVASRGADAPIRVWVPGCSTGEEAFSIAMLLHEQASAAGKLPNFQIFASDIDERALEVGRSGRYPASLAQEIPQARLNRYFVREDGTYRVVGDLRESILFSLHDLLRDPPFSHLDLVSCRNLLIYLNPDLQDRVIPLFHYALREDGYLFLGSSENVTRHPRLFAEIDNGGRIFQRRRDVRPRLPEFPLVPHARRRGRPPPDAQPETDDSLRALAERQAFDRFGPAHVVINRSGDVLHTSAKTGKYLEMPAGAPDNNLFAMARSGLRAALRAMVRQAVDAGRLARQTGIDVGTNGGRQVIDLSVEPLRRPGRQDALYLVVFRDVGGLQPEIDTPPDADDDSSGLVRHLEAELRALRERLQTSNEELESSNEELKSANEELSSVNEELQSSNEELETSKEELSSMNEELQTVNAELNARVEQLSRANSDILNLLESTQIATVFLDRDLCIKRFTPSAKDLFHLVESDEGRPIAHLRPRFAADTLQEDAEKVLRDLEPVERVVKTAETGVLYAMRVLPYRTLDREIAGVVITFVDITRISIAEAKVEALTHDLRNRVESLETLLDLVPVGIFFAREDGGWRVSLNRAAAHLLGRNDTERTSQTLSGDIEILLDGRPLDPDAQPLLRSARTGEAVEGFEAQIARPDGSRRDVIISSAPLRDEAGNVRGAVAAMADITERKRSEQHQEMLLHELQHRVKNILATIAALAARMLRSSDTMDQFAEGFTARLQAMARTHELLSQGRWRGADLKEVVKLSLLPYRTSDLGNLTVEGPPAVLAPRDAAALGMILHELASNAAKYGALATNEGRVDVHWRLKGDAPEEVVTLTWKEHAPNPVPEPKRAGFGTKFVKRSSAYELAGKADLEIEADGARCVIEFPLRRPGSQDLAQDRAAHDEG
jgi:two-component system, chemotaxis family, CheB/CheR fusion protein